MTDIDAIHEDLEKRVAKFRIKLAGKAGFEKAARANLERCLAKEETLAEEVNTINAAKEVLEIVIESKKEELRCRVQDLVTKGLRAVFNRDDYEFKLELVIGRQSSVKAVPTLVSNFKGAPIEVPILDGHGGGVADVVSFLLRVLYLVMTRPSLRPLMVLDESFKHVSRENLRGVSQLLKELNKTFGIQFIMVTHKAEMLDAADVVYRSSINDGVTEFSLEHDLNDTLYHQAPGVRQQTEEIEFDHGALNANLFSRQGNIVELNPTKKKPGRKFKKRRKKKL